MWTAGGAGGSGFGAPGDAGALVQQYWNALSEAMRSSSGAARPEDPWKTAMDSWSQLAGGRQHSDAADVIERFSAQARQWFGMMQQVAGQFAGRSASAEDIAGAWKQAMSGGGNPFASLFGEMGGRGQSGFDQWYEQAAPMLNGMLGGMRQEGMGWLRTPAFGLNREHQERWQVLAEAQLELQQNNDAYKALMLEAGRDAFERFEQKLAERSEPGRQLQSARALFDLWIDAAEEAYAEIALSTGFRKVYGELVNAQMRVRAGIQREVELIGGLFGIPGRTEMDAAHRKIAELERQLWRQRNGAPVQAAQTNSSPAKSAKSSLATEKAKKTIKKKPVSKPAAKTKPAAKKASASKAKASRVTAKPAVKRAPRQAIAAITMPKPLKPIPVKQMTAPRTAKRKR